ncbi:hypothetical protein BC832DRAFT_435402 [Gaertneriomyces semiglobifer]|nr:hypothetical protein BC832DRAFT_435402 [Gaertneriomyces semiglobifer]
MAIDSPDIMVGTPDRPSDRRLSVSNSGKGMSRIQALLKEETQHIAKEIAHERALNLASASYTLDVMDEEIPSDLLANSSFTTQRSKIEEEVSAIVPVPVRTVAIPNSALKDPATYISHSSKLNPENSFLSRQQEVISCSPSLSPVHTTFAAAISMSPGNAERKGKRKHSGDSERYEPYSKRHHRMPSSPTVQSPSIGTGAYFRASSTPPPFSLPFPLVFQRQRSPSVSSTSSVSSMWGVEKNGGNASHTNGSGYAMSTVASTSVPTGLPGSAHLMLGTTPPPASPKALGAFLNLGGTQEGFTKMSITE